jgi:L-aspartate oxidase
MINGSASASGPSPDILIVGAGLAGLFLALKLAPRKVRVLSPAPLGTMASSAWAQGGLAAALHPEDSAEKHAADTVAAGAGLVDPVVARLIAEDGPARVRDLIAIGVPFDRTPDGALALSLEAAHSHARVARVAGDLAGREIMAALVRAARAAPHIEIIEEVRAVSLIQDDNGRIGGVLAETREGLIAPMTALETVLCAGGIGGLFRVTTNPVSALGDALAMAWNAGGLITDPEFVQFHPTAIDVGRDPAPLATEALRGEGAHLVGADGQPFMARYHPDGDLAPRDIVARAIASETVEGRATYLDARKAVGSHFPEHFPTVFGACMSAGIDPRTALIPVAPAAHYHMGGIATDMWGKTSLDGLSACGECASTGAHGANRLASNSLLEAVVFAERIARRILSETLIEAEPAGGRPPARMQAKQLGQLRARMSNLCGVVRNRAGLLELTDWIEKEMTRIGRAHPLVAASLVVHGALMREESRGGHFRQDYPGSLAPAHTHISQPPIRRTERPFTDASFSRPDASAPA